MFRITDVKYDVLGAMSMRTTLSIDDDVLEEIRKRAEEEGETIGEAVSELLREALSANSPPIEYPAGFEPLPLRPRQPRVTMELINALRDELP